MKITRTTERIIIENERKIIERVTEVIERKPILSIISIAGFLLGGLKSFFGL